MPLSSTNGSPSTGGACRAASPSRPRHGWRAGLSATLAALLVAGCGHVAAPPSPAGSSAATAPTVAPAPAGLRELLAPTGVLRIGVYPGSPTSLVRGPGADETRGVAVELGRDLAKRLGVPAQLVVLERVPEIIEALKGGRADVTLTNASPARALEVDFTPPVVLLESGWLVTAASGIASAAQVDVAGVRVGVAQGSTSQGVLGRELKAARVVPMPSVVVAAEQMRQGGLEVFASNKGILFEMNDRVPGSRVLDGRWSLEQLALAVPKGRDAAAGFLRAYVAEPGTQALVRAAATRAGLRGLAAPDSVKP